MKIGIAILVTAALTLLVVFLTGLIGMALTIFKFVFWAAILVGLIALMMKLFGGKKSTARSGADYDMKQLESWDKMFEEYKQGSDFKTK